MEEILFVWYDLQFHELLHEKNDKNREATSIYSTEDNNKIEGKVNNFYFDNTNLYRKVGLGTGETKISRK